MSCFCCKELLINAAFRKQGLLALTQNKYKEEGEKMKISSEKVPESLQFLSYFLFFFIHQL